MFLSSIYLIVYRTRHRNVIELLLACEHESTGLYLVFPLANGNLNDYWRKHGQHLPLYEDALWLIKQCTDLKYGPDHPLCTRSIVTRRSRRRAAAETRNEILGPAGGRVPGLDHSPNGEDQKSHWEDDSVFDEPAGG